MPNSARTQTIYDINPPHDSKGKTYLSQTLLSWDQVATGLPCELRWTAEAIVWSFTGVSMETHTSSVVSNIREAVWR